PTPTAISTLSLHDALPICLKINAAIQNAKAFLVIRQEFGSFDAYVWRFIKGKPIKRKRGAPVLPSTPESDALSRDLIKRGCKFVDRKSTRLNSSHVSISYA